MGVGRHRNLEESGWNAFWWWIGSQSHYDEPRSSSWIFKWRKIFSKNSEQIEYVSLLDELKIWLILAFAGSSAFTISNLRSLSWMMRCSWAKSENSALKNCSSPRFSYVGLWHFHLCGKTQKGRIHRGTAWSANRLITYAAWERAGKKQDSANVQIDIVELRKETWQHID